MHRTTPEFWAAYGQLDVTVQEAADRSFQMLLGDSSHPSLHFKKVKGLWSARVDRSYRAVAIQHNGNYVWFWIGPHDEYMRIISQR